MLSFVCLIAKRVLVGFPLTTIHSEYQKRFRLVFKTIWIQNVSCFRYEDVDISDSDADMVISVDKIKEEKCDSSYDEDCADSDDGIRVGSRTRNNRPNVPSVANSHDIETLENFIQERNNLKSIPLPKADLITEDDDLWLIQCPSTLNIDSLKDVPIFNSSKNKIKIPNTKYECVVIEKESRQNLMLVLPSVNKDSTSINNYKLKGKFIVREKLKSQPDAIVKEEERINVPFPSDLKIRHTLFGADFENHINLPSDVIEKLNNPPKYKEHKVKNSSESSGKKRKRKTSDSFDGQEPKRVKKEKMWDSEISIEQSLFSSPVKKSKKA